MVRAARPGRMKETTLPIPKRLSLALALLPLVVGGCKSKNEITAVGGTYGQEISRSGCPAVAIPAATGDVTLFDPPSSRDSRAIDVVAAITHLQGTCDETAPDTIHSTASFQVEARRGTAAGARDVVLPYFAVVMRAGDKIVSKSQSQVLIHFDDGKLTATTNGQATAGIARVEATLPANVIAQLSRKRKAEDADASVDPLSDPGVRAAITKASFELLVGFQLTREQLAYNATR